MGNRAHNLLRCFNPIHCGGTAGSIASRWGISLIALNFHITLSHRLQPRTVLHNDVTFILSSPPFIVLLFYYLFLLWCILVVSYSFNTVSNGQFIIPFISANLIRLSNSVLLFICIIVCFYLLRGEGFARTYRITQKTPSDMQGSRRECRKAELAEQRGFSIWISFLHRFF